MPIIGQVEKHSWKVKLLNIVIHLLLILGSATMVYPLLLMISGSFKSSIDFANFTLIPQYLSQDLELFRKFINTKYSNRPDIGYLSYKEPRTTTDTVMPPERICKEMMEDYADFLEGIRRNKPHYWRMQAMSFEQGVDTLAVRKFREWIQTRPEFGKGKEGLAKFNRMFDTEYEHWNDLELSRAENFLDRRAVTNFDSGLLKYLKDFKNEVCTDHLLVNWCDIEGEYIAFLRRKVDQDLEGINRKLHTDFNSWADISLPETVPADNPYLAQQWTAFVKTEMNPAFIRIDEAKASGAWRTYLLKKYGSIEKLGAVYGAGNWRTPEDIRFFETDPETGMMHTDWLDFLYQDSSVSSLWSDFIKKKYQTIARLNAAWGVKFRSFSEIPAVDEFAPLPEGLPAQAKKDCKALRQEIAERRTWEVPAEAIKVETLANEYRKYLAAKFGTPQKMDEAYGNGFKDFSGVLLPESAPGENNLQETRDWNEFVRGLPEEKISLNRLASTQYKKWLAARSTGNAICDNTAIARDYKMKVTDLNTVPSLITYPRNDVIRYTNKAREDYIAAIRSGEFSRFYRLNDPQEFQREWEEFLKKKYRTVEKLNESRKLTHRDFASAALPSKMFDWYQMELNRSAIIGEYLKRNYLMVFDTLIMNGNAALNTVIYCFLAVLAALIVNPLCAYGLSRYRPASSYKILLFLLLPMAFPAMVLAIPQFLLIKEFGLLNTFACLILPGMAQGYSIFLLKGFFDSLPKELFESAALDGASEWTVFWNIGMSLSTPILSVIALSAFTAAYGNFMLAFLMCQKQSMWTMMVYLYQLQLRASSSVGFAALIVAAVPTLIVFIFCQNIIIRGIVVPTEK